MFTVNAITNARDYRSSTVSTVFLKAGRVLVSRIVAGRLFQVGLRGPATSQARSPILVFVPGTKTSDEFDDGRRNLLQSSDISLILSTSGHNAVPIEHLSHRPPNSANNSVLLSCPSQAWIKEEVSANSRYLNDAAANQHVLHRQIHSYKAEA